MIKETRVNDLEGGRKNLFKKEDFMEKPSKNPS